MEFLIEATYLHPVACVADLDAAGGGPLAVELLETAIVLWRDAEGEIRAFTDRCPHRGAALSRGRLIDGGLECPYHGWRFAADGRCTEVPAVPDFVPPPEHRVVSYAVQVAYGLVWVAMAPSAELPDDLTPPAFEAEDDPDLYKFTCGPYDVATSAPRIVENFLDMSHFSFVHEHWLGSRDHMSLLPYRVETTDDGFIAVECRAWQPRASANATGGAMIEYTYEVNAPYTSVLTKMPDATAVDQPMVREAIALFVCPQTPERSRVWMRLAMYRADKTDEELKAFQDTIFLQDQPVLESQRPRRLPITPEAPVKELHSAADRSSAAYRRYLRDRGITFGIC